MMKNLNRALVLLALVVENGFADSRYPIEQCKDSRVIFNVVMVRKQSAAFVGELPVRVYLRLVNVQKEPIFVEVFDLSSKKGDGALLHDVLEKDACALRSTDDRDIPVLSIGYSRIHTFSVVKIDPSDSISFSVPADHLQNDRCVRIKYWSGQESPPLETAGYQYACFKVKGSWLTAAMRISRSRRNQ